MISTNVRYNPPDLAQIISDLPKNLRGLAVEEASRYLVGDETRGLKHYPAYQYITRRQAYGQTFKSPAQQRKVMAMIHSGEILPGFPRRTGRTQRGWIIIYDGVKSRIINSEIGAYYTADDIGQSRHENLVGWRRESQIIATNENGMILAVDRMFDNYLKAKGL